MSVNIFDKQKGDIVQIAGNAFNNNIDTVARNAIAAHEGDTVVHVTSSDKAVLNAVSNPNLLINPDFRINQRGKSVYTSVASTSPVSYYSVDGWIFLRSASADLGDYTATPNNSGSLLIDNQTNGTIVFYQKIENFTDLYGKQVTFSCSVDGVISTLTANVANTTGQIAAKSTDFGFLRIYGVADNRVEVEFYINSGITVNINWAKLEIGSIITQFMSPDPTTELLKCQRYYQVHSSGGIVAVDMRPSMATITDIKQRSDGNYEYIAEL